MVKIHFAPLLICAVTMAVVTTSRCAEDHQTREVISPEDLVEVLVVDEHSPSWQRHDPSPAWPSTSDGSPQP